MKLRHLAAVAISVALSLPAQAQNIFEIGVGIKFCRTLTDDAQRLKCYDSLLAEKAPSSKDDRQQIQQEWRIEESKSPVDDSPQIIATLGTPPESVLVLRCKERKTDAFFAQPFKYLGDNVKVLMRINDGKPIETNWHAANNGQGAFAPAAVQFIGALPDDGRLFLRATGFQGNTIDGSFDLGKVSEIRDRIAKACQWNAIVAPRPTPTKPPSSKPAQ